MKRHQLSPPDEEIDAFLPTLLKKGKEPSASAELPAPVAQQIAIEADRSETATAAD